MVSTEQALDIHLPAPAALAQLAAVADEARAVHLHGTELAALLHAAALAARHGHGQAHADAHAHGDAHARAHAHAATLATQALALSDDTEALHADRALRWLAPAQALAAAGQAAAAAEQARAGQAWLRTTAAAHVASEFADSFLHQHPLHGLLMAWPTGA